MWSALLTPESLHQQLAVDIVHWKFDGLDAGAAKALQVRSENGEGQTTVLATSYRARVWETMLNGKLPVLSKAALRLMALHATSCGPERNWSQWRAVCRPNRCACVCADQVLWHLRFQCTV
jgi:hypothetical protein